MSVGSRAALDLGPLMNPQTIGIIGASRRRSRGTRVLENLRVAGFEGPIYPINPKYEDIDGLACYPSTADVPETIDSLVVAIPAAAVPEALREARVAGVRSATVMSSGFAEAGAGGRTRHLALEEMAEDGFVICGPNCYGILNVATRAAAFSGTLPAQLRSGPLALVSQSGGVSNLIVNPLMDWRGLGFKYVASCGNQAGAKVEDYVAFLIDDPDVKVVGCFVEGLSSARRIITIGAAAAERGKWIVVLKSGRSHVAQEAIASHTGSIAGSTRVAEALLDQAGIIQADDLDQFVEIIALLGSARQPAAIMNRVFVLTGLGGEASLVADAAATNGVLLPPLHDDSIAALDEILPQFANKQNPLDGTGAMFEDETVFPSCLEVATKDKNTDVVAVNLRTGWNPMRQFAGALANLETSAASKVVAYGSASVGPVDEAVVDSLARAGVPLLLGTSNAMSAIGKVSAINRARGHHAVPAEPAVSAAPRVEWPDDPSALDASIAWDLLEAYGLPVVAQHAARDAKEAAAAAKAIGFPVAVKLADFDISHKSDIGGVELGLRTEEQVADAYCRVASQLALHRPVHESVKVIVQAMSAPGVELFAGITRDPALGPAVVVGTGGVFVEILDDALVILPPFTHAEALALLGRLRSAKILAGARGAPASDVTSAADVVVRLGHMALDLPPYVSAVDLNPLIVHESGHGLSCVDVWMEAKTPA